MIVKFINVRTESDFGMIRPVWLNALDVIPRRSFDLSFYSPNQLYRNSRVYLSDRTTSIVSSVACACS